MLQTKNLLRSHILMFLFLGLGSFQCAYSQISGATSVTANSTHTYQIDKGMYFPFSDWIISNGTEQSSWSSGTTYYVTVLWDGGLSNGTVVFPATNDYLYVTVASSTPPMPTITNNCGNTVLTRASPPGNLTYYWQSSATGTSTSNSSVSVTRTTGTVYYLRAKNIGASTWSSARTVNYTIKSVPSTPGTPSITNNCGSTVLTRSNPPSGVTFYWQSSSSGTSTSNSSSTITRTSGTVYYLRARNNSNLCWSTARTINYSVNAAPGIPSTPSVTNNCGNTVLTRSNPPSGVTWYWQSSSSGTSTGNSSSTVTRTSGTVYYLRPRNNSSGCWGSARSVSYAVNSVPSTPATPSVTNNCGSTVLTRSNPPSGVTFYWQSSSSGTSTGNSSSTITRTSGTVYYLRPRNNSSGCWGSARSVSYTINTIPGTPSTPSVTNNCGNTVLTRSNPPSGVTWYWQSSTSGTSTGNSSSTITRTSGTVYYLRPRNNSSGCWGSARSVSYTVNSVPGTPATPSITNNCGNTVLTRSNPPSGVTFYWQSSSSGTSTGNSSSTITRTSGTVYYLRPRNNSSGCWGSARSVSYTINTVPGTPATPSVTNNCGNTVLTRSTPPSGITFYWQSSSSGTSTGNSSSTITRTSGTVYYLRPRNNSSGCWGSARSVSYTVNTVPGTPATPSVTNNCGNTVLTRSNPPSGVTFYWQSSSSGTSTSDSNSTITRTSGTVYYLRPRNNSSGCWGSARSVSYTVNTVPGTPTTPSVTNNCGNTVLTRSTPPSGITFYWQSSSSGTSTSDSNSTITRTTGTVYYLRPRNNSSGCWGTARSVSYSVNTVPATPTTPTVTNNCGNTVLTRSTPPSGVTFYWQSSSSGTSTSNSSTTITRTSGTSYYLRARNNTSACWGTAVNVTYSINLGPVWYADTDGDGFGDPNSSQRACARPAGYVENKSDLAINTPGTNFGTTNNTYTPATKSDENYIYTRSYQNPMSNPGDVVSNNDIIEQITYFDGLGRPMQNIAIKASGREAAPLNLQANIPEWSMDWTAGSGSTAFFNQNGVTSENLRINGADPHGNISLLWECGNEADNSSDGGWNTDYFNVDKNSTYRYTAWVKRNYSNNGTTYHGTQNVNNLSGSANGNPYFWYGDLPQLDQWYLMVGIVHPAGYSGGDTGVSGVYDLQGNKVIDGNEFTWRSDTSTSRFRSYLYYATDVSVRQYFYAPVVQKIDGSENSITEIISGTEGQGGTLTDIITHIDYDDYGRQDKEWLPYREATGSLGSYRGDKALATQQYYQANYADDFTGITNADDIVAYAQKGFEASPLNRVLEQAAPGEDWKLGGGHGIEFNYQSNAGNEVKQYGVDLSGSAPALTLSASNSGYYSADELYKSITKDENYDATSSTVAHTTEEFKDKQGRVILKRTYGTSVVNGVSQTNIAHDTYYVYDDYGNLSYVLPPKMEAGDAATTLTAVNNALDNLGYQYIYDHRNRLVEKKIPGKGWEYIIYDRLDRPVLTQDAVQRLTNTWLFTKYDVFGRVAYTGTHTNGTQTGRANVQGHFDTQNNVPTKLYESKVSSGTGHDNSYYTNVNYPSTNIEILTVNYYDNYGFDLATLSLPGSHDGQTIINNDNTSPGLTKSLATGSKVRVLGTTSWITTITGYDVKGRPIYVASNNSYLSAIDIVKSTLDFAGKVLKTQTEHDKGSTSVDTEDLFTYDHVGRLLKQTQELDNTNVLEVIAENHYDNLGQLERKDVGGKTTQSRLQQIDYTYNVRGWLKQINNPTTLGSDLFGFKISYNEGANALYNGNIAQTNWNTASINSSGNPVSNTYTYTYDALNRITNGTDNTGNYNLNSISYDKNGNITALSRAGHTDDTNPSTFVTSMDNLSYYYNGNQLHSVTDASGYNTGFKDGNGSDAIYNNGNDDYTYDVNGNMLKDLNKGISSNITYNHLNLPVLVTLPNGNISYIYDATGVKLEKKVVENGKSNAYTFYAGNYVYDRTGDTGDGSLKFFNHAEGHVDTSNGYEYVYQYKDHLGNVRLSYKDNGGTLQILEENNYYPFGLKHKGYNTNVASTNIALKKTYNGKEFQDELDLNWHDYGARNYDATLGRWMNIDPMADSFHPVSPYNFALNSPLIFTDPNGLEAIVVTGGEYDSEKRYKYNFVETSIKQLWNLIKEGKDESITWAVMSAGYSKSDMKNFAAIAEALGVNFQAIDSDKGLTNYLNSKDTGNSKVSDERKDDLVTNVTVFGHGFSGKAEFGYNQGEPTRSNFSWGMDDASELDSNAFSKDSNICFYTCNAGTDINGGWAGKSLISTVSKSTKASVVSGYWGRTDYATMNNGESKIDKIARFLNGFNAGGSRSLPSPGKKNGTNDKSTLISVKKWDNK